MSIFIIFHPFLIIKTSVPNILYCCKHPEVYLPLIYLTDYKFHLLIDLKWSYFHQQYCFHFLANIPTPKALCSPLNQQGRSGNFAWPLIPRVIHIYWLGICESALASRLCESAISFSCGERDVMRWHLCWTADTHIHIIDVWYEKALTEQIGRQSI